MVTRTPLQQPTKSGARIEADPGSGRVPERGTLGLGDTAWAKAKQRVVVIGPLAAADLVSAAAAGAAGEALGLAERTIYALVRRYRQSGGLLASLAPQASPGGRGKTRLSPAAEQMIAEAIRTEYLTRQKKSAEAVVRAVRQQAKIVGMAPPAPNTVRARVRAVKADLAARRRVAFSTRRPQQGESHSGALCTSRI